MFKQYQRDTDPAFINQLIEDIRFNARRTIGLSRREWRGTAIQATVDWINSWEADWDLACCWHAGENMRDVQAGWAADWLQRQLSAYFNKLQKVVFKHIRCKDRPNIARFITLEYSARVGWHAHGIMETPKHMTRDEFSEIMRELWIEHIGDGCTKEFKAHLFWCDEIRGAYKHYALKAAIERHDDAHRQPNAFIDLSNTYQPTMTSASAPSSVS